MRHARNVTFVLLLLVAFATLARNGRASDLGCVGEDGIGYTDEQGPIYCSGQSGTCCDAAWDADSADTVETFCDPYGGPDWEESYWESSLDTQTQCNDFKITCICAYVYPN